MVVANCLVRWRGKREDKVGGCREEMMSAVGHQLTECSIDVVGMVRIPSFWVCPTFMICYKSRL